MNAPRLRSSCTLQHLLGLEAALYAAAVSVCLGLCIAMTPLLLAKARGVALFTGSMPARLEMVERFAFGQPQVVTEGNLLGLRPAWQPGQAATPLLWLCGRRRPPAGWETLPPPVQPASTPDYAVCSAGAKPW